MDDVESQSTINQRRSKDGNVKATSEDRVASADRADLGEDSLENEQNEPSYPARVNVTIEKAGKGAMHVETVAQDGLIQIENVSYFENAELANAQTAEKEWSRQSLYAGPPFGNLDEDLQVLLERYLDERGIDTALATFIPDYIDFKEQKEYVRWLASKLTLDNWPVWFHVLTVPVQISRRLSMHKGSLVRCMNHASSMSSFVQQALRFDIVTPPFPSVCYFSFLS